jgi:hypothetical protein
VSRRVQDGRALVSGVVKAEDQRADIAGPSGGLRPGATKPTPAQARARAEDRYVGEELPPGYERGTAVVSPELTGAPRPHRDESQPDAAWSRLDAAKEQDTAPTSSPGKSAAGKVIGEVRAHAAKVAADYAAAKGTPHEAAALAAVKETTVLMEHAASKI